jgi:hypothetical protein
MKKELKEKLGRHAVLTAKMLEQTITDDEKGELKKLTKAIEKATNPPEVTLKTSLTTVTLKEFKEQIEAMKAGEPTVKELALAKRNLAAVRKQGKTLETDVVAIEVLEKDDHSEQIAGLEARIRELEEKAVAAMGDNAGDGDGDDTGDEDGKTLKADTEAPTAMALALEAISAVIGKMEALKVAFEAGNVDMEQVNKAWPNWETRELVESAASILAKMDEFKKLLEEISPKIDAVKGVGDGAGDNAGGDGGDAGDDKTTKGADDDEIQKTVDAFSTGCDLAPKSTGGQSDWDGVQKHKDKDGTVAGFNRGND